MKKSTFGIVDWLFATGIMVIIMTAAYLVVYTDYFKKKSSYRAKVENQPVQFAPGLMKVTIQREEWTEPDEALVLDSEAPRIIVGKTYKFKELYLNGTRIFMLQTSE